MAVGRELAYGFEASSRVINALLMREIKTRFGKHRLGYIWALIEPMMLVGVKVAIFMTMGKSEASGMPAIPFLVVGVVGILIFRHTTQKTMNAVSGNQALLAFPNVRVFDLITARAMLESATLMVVFIILSAGVIAAGMTDGTPNVPRVAFALVLYALYGYGLGMTLAMFVPKFPTLERVVPHALLRPAYFLSGVFFTAEMLPAGLREILLYNPLLHITEIARSGFFVQFESKYADPKYAMSGALIVLATGFLALARRRHKVIAT